MFLLTQVFSESYGHQSLCSIHVIKPTDPNFEHTKYEPDISSHARKKWGVKIEVDCRTPCICSRDEVATALDATHALAAHRKEKNARTFKKSLLPY